MWRGKKSVCPGCSRTASGRETSARRVAKRRERHIGVDARGVCNNGHCSLKCSRRGWRIMASCSLHIRDGRQLYLSWLLPLHCSCNFIGICIRLESFTFRLVGVGEVPFSLWILMRERWQNVFSYVLVKLSCRFNNDITSFVGTFRNIILYVYIYDISIYLRFGTFSCEPREFFTRNQI